MNANQCHHVPCRSRRISIAGCAKTVGIPVRDCFRGVARDRALYDHAYPVSRNFRARAPRGYDDVILFGGIGVALLVSIPKKEKATAAV